MPRKQAPPTDAYDGPIPDPLELERLLDQTRKHAFLGNNAAFLGSLLCSHEFCWDNPGGAVTETAATDGVALWWAVKDFLRCSSEERRCTLIHELHHTGRLHHLRRGNRCPDIWNVACDYRINNDMIRDGFHLPDNGWWIFDPSLDANGVMAEEEIYDLLMKNALPTPKVIRIDLKDPPSGAVLSSILATVVRAVQAAEVGGQAGTLPGNLRKVLNTFLEPKIPWKNVLYRWMTDLMDSFEYTWKRPNRRFQNEYMPSQEQDMGRLDHLVFIEDVSGSISEQDSITFNSEVKYIQEQLKPRKLTLLQFDTKIQQVREFVEDEPFEKIELEGGGGTSLVCVRDWIEKNKPTAAIIFSDLQCDPMAPLTQDIPTIWVAIRNKQAIVPFGELIHIAE